MLTSIVEKTIDEEAKEFAENVRRDDQWLADDLGDELDNPEIISPKHLLEKLRGIGVQYYIPGMLEYYRHCNRERGYYDAVAVPLVVLDDDRYATVIDYKDSCLCLGKWVYETFNYETRPSYIERENYDGIIFSIVDRLLDFDCVGSDILYEWPWEENLNQ